MIIKECLICGKKFKTIKSKLKIGKGKFCSCKCYYVAKRGKKMGERPDWVRKKLSIAQKWKPRPWTTGNKNGNWLGDNVGYVGIHQWLRKQYGKADKCENLDCKCINPKRYEWALIKGKLYERKRENFMMLCKSCHIKYDFTEETREKLRINGKKNGAKNLLQYRGLL